MTKKSPLTIPCAANNIIMVKALEKIRFCPVLSIAKLVAILTDAFS